MTRRKQQLKIKRMTALQKINHIVTVKRLYRRLMKEILSETNKKRFIECDSPLLYVKTTLMLNNVQ